MMEEYKTAILFLLNRAKEQLTEEEYAKLKAFIRMVIHDENADC